MITIVDALNVAANWQTRQPDGTPGSTELTAANATGTSYLGTDQTSMLLTGSTSALDHSIRRTLPAVDATVWPDLAIAVRADREATGSDASPFYLRLRVGSAAVDLDDPANTWHRYLPIKAVDTWNPLRLSLHDLPANIRDAITQVEITCTDASREFACHLDDLNLVRDELISDVDAALHALLHNQLTLTGLVPALELVTGAALPANPRPAFAIANYKLEWNEERTNRQPSSSDYVDDGFRLRPDRIAYVAHYAILALAATRAEQAEMLDFACQAVPPRATLVVNDYRADAWHVPTPSFHETPWPAFYPQLHVAAMNWTEIGTATPVRPTRNVRIEAEAF
ncbi:MAG: hypothetical protein ACE37K_06150 [Planctomycetota bacterium]